MSSNYHLTELRFFSKDIKEKRTISKLFKFGGLNSYGEPNKKELEEFHFKFNEKLKEISPRIQIDYEFFKGIIFGPYSGPTVDYSRDSCVVVSLLHKGDFAESPLLLTKFLKKVLPSLEILTYGAHKDTNTEVWIKSTEANGIEIKKLKLSKYDTDPKNISYVQETYAWQEKDLSFIVDTGLVECEGFEEIYKDLATDHIVQPEIPDSFAQDMFNLFKEYNLLPESVKTLPAEYAEPEICFVELIELCSSKLLISYPEIPTSWNEGDHGELYSSLIHEFCSMTGISIDNFSIKVPRDLNGDYNHDENIIINFEYLGSEHTWTFSVETDVEYLDVFSEWACSTLQGSYLWDCENYTGYFLPKELVVKLNSLGISNKFFKDID